MKIDRDKEIAVNLRKPKTLWTVLRKLLMRNTTGVSDRGGGGNKTLKRNLFSIGKNGVMKEGMKNRICIRRRCFRHRGPPYLFVLNRVTGWELENLW